MPDITIIVDKDGISRSLYQETLDLSALGDVIDVYRASHVEPDPTNRGTWFADMRPVGGPVYRGFAKSSNAVKTSFRDPMVGSPSASATTQNLRRKNMATAEMTDRETDTEDDIQLVDQLQRHLTVYSLNSGDIDLLA